MVGIGALNAAILVRIQVLQQFRSEVSRDLRASRKAHISDSRPSCGVPKSIDKKLFI